MTTARRFSCSTGGAILAGRRRLGRLLTLLGLVGLSVGALAAWDGRVVPALLAGGAGFLAFFARHMSADLDPLWLEIDGDRLIVQMRRQRQTLILPGATVRRLTDGEIEHLTRLATSAGITAGTGGFDSHRLGELDLYASQLDHAVLIDQGETSAVVTPDTPGLFLEAAVEAGATASTPARIAAHE